MNLLKLHIVFLLAAHFILIANTRRSGVLELTKVTCDGFDNSFATIKKCQMTKRKDKRMGWTFYAQLHKRIENMTVYAKLWHSVNKKFQPFLYDDKIDFCQFIVAAKRHVLWGPVYEMLSKASNMNHTCPYDDALIINDFVLEGYQFNVLPRGQYKMDFVLTIDDDPKIKNSAVYDKK